MMVISAGRPYSWMCFLLRPSKKLPMKFICSLIATRSTFLSAGTFQPSLTWAKSTKPRYIRPRPPKGSNSQPYPVLSVSPNTLFRVWRSEPVPLGPWSQFWSSGRAITLIPPWIASRYRRQAVSTHLHIGEVRIWVIFGVCSFKNLSCHSSHHVIPSSVSLGSKRSLRLTDSSPLWGLCSP